MSPGFAWALLIVAGLLDILWAGTMKMSDGLSRPGWTIASVVVLAALVVALGQAVKVLPLGTAYAVWTGVGAVGTVLLGIVVFGEQATFGRLACVAAIVGGVIGLKLLKA